jgi:Mor family transcriptional regulator
VRRLIVEIYAGILLSPKPVSRIALTKCERNEEIRLRHRCGESLSGLAEVFGLTEQRIWQIVRGRRK